MIERLPFKENTTHMTDEEVQNYIDEYEAGACSWEDYEEYTPSSYYGDYSPSNPWDAPGMSISDFI